MIVGLVLEQQQPLLRLAVHIHINFDGAGVDFLGLVQLRQIALLFEIAGGNGRHIHEIDGLGTTQVTAHGEVLVPCALQELVLKFGTVNRRQERRMTAVIGPVGVDHADLRDGRVTMLGAEIVPAEADIVRIHRQCVFLHECSKTGFVQFAEAVAGIDRRRNVVLYIECVHRVQRSFTAFHGVDDVLFRRLNLRLGQVAVEHIHLGGTHKRTVTLGDDLDALCGGVGTLVKLTGQILHGEHGAIICIADRIGAHIQLRLGEYGFFALLKQRLVDFLHIVAVENTHTLERINAEERAKVGAKRTCLMLQSRFFFYIYSVNHSSSLRL